MGIEGGTYTPGQLIPGNGGYPFKGPVNSAVLLTLEGKKHIIEAKRTVNSLGKTKEDALRLVEICEILRQKCIEKNIDYTPSGISTPVDHWLKWTMYTIAPFDTTSMKQIDVGGEKKRVYNVFKWKIPMYQRFANHMIDLLDKEGILNFGF